MLFSFSNKSVCILPLSVCGMVFCFPQSQALYPSFSLKHSLPADVVLASHGASHSAISDGMGDYMVLTLLCLVTTLEEM